MHAQGDESLERAREFVRDVVRGIWQQEISDEDVERLARSIDAAITIRRKEHM